MGFSPRKQDHALYLMGGLEMHKAGLQNQVSRKQLKAVCISKG
jgi:hypothetical protein